MTNNENTLTAIEELLAIRKIEQLKHRYMRAIDTHDCELMESCFMPDASVWYMDGAISSTGRDNILRQFREGLLDDDNHFSSHIALHPEITITGPDSATGVWRFQDTVFNIGPSTPERLNFGLRGGQRVEGAGIYHDEYVRLDGSWRIARTGFVRIYEYWSTPGYPVETGFDRHCVHALKVNKARGRRSTSN